MSDPVLASRLRRFSATAIDFLVLPPFALFIMLATGLMEGAEAYVWPQPILRLFGLMVVSYFVVHGYWIWRGGGSVGKRLLGLDLVAIGDGNRLSVPRLALRTFAIPFALLLAILADVYPATLVVAAIVVVDPLCALGPSGRALHDYIAGSVIYRRND